jgi:hypothetical protein
MPRYAAGPSIAMMPSVESPAARYNKLLRRLGITDRTVDEATAARVDAELAQLARNARA